jgi:hypothetical protein
MDAEMLRPDASDLGLLADVLGCLLAVLVAKCGEKVQLVVGAAVAERDLMIKVPFVTGADGPA